MIFAFMFVIFHVVLCLSVLLALWRRRFIYILPVLLLLLSGYTYLGWTYIQGKPKPMVHTYMEEILYSDISDGQITGVDYDEGEAIYVMVRVDDDSVPVLYKLPWDENAMNRLSELWNSTQRGGSEVQFDMREAKDYHYERIFKLEPIEPSPPKRRDR